MDKNLIIELPAQNISTGRLLKLIAEKTETRFAITGNIIAFFSNKTLQAPIAGYIEGLITDEEGNPLPAVTISAPSYSKYYISSRTGNFRIPADRKYVLLQISHTTFESQNVRATINERLQIIMVKRSSHLQEIQVSTSAFNFTRKHTANPVLVEAKDLPSINSYNIFSSLQGRIPGLLITDDNGSPGTGCKIQLRGNQSIGLIHGSFNNSLNSPLILLNGTILAPATLPLRNLSSAIGDPETDNNRRGINILNTLNLEDIESIEVIRDADATAIFGSRGGHGAISIRTKRANAFQAPRYNVNISRGGSVTAFMPRMMNSSQYAEMRREAMSNDGVYENIHTAPDLLQWPADRNTNWSKFLLGNTANTRHYHVSGSGSFNDKFSIYCGIGFREETTVLPSKFRNGDASLFINSSFKVDKKTKTDFTILVSSERQNLPALNPMSLIYLAPNAPAATNAEGKLVFEENGLSFTNIYAQLLNRYNTELTTILSSLNLEHIISTKLKFSVRAGANKIQLNENSIFPKAVAPLLSNMQGTIHYGGSNWYNLSIEPQFQFKDSSRNNKYSTQINFGSAMNVQGIKGEKLSLTGYDNDKFLGILEAAGNIAQQRSGLSMKQKSIYGSFNFSYEKKYAIQLIGRFDAPPRRIQESSYAFWGAIGTSWEFSNEKIIKKIVPFLASGILRANFGTSGNDNFINNYNSYLQQQQPLSYHVSMLPEQTQLPAWGGEFTSKKDVTVDLLFRSNMFVSLSWYHNVTSNQLLTALIPGQTGQSFIYSENQKASVQNNGFEISLSLKPYLRRNRSWETSLVMAFPQNKLRSFPDLKNSLYKRTLTVGKSITEQYGLRFSHVDPITGLSSFVDVSGDGVISYPEDIVPVGNLDPVLFGSLNNSVRLGKWIFQAFIEGKVQKQFNSYLYYLARTPGSFRSDMLTNQPASMLDRWRNSGEASSFQKLSATGNPQYRKAVADLMNSNLMLVNGSYLRLRQLSISWYPPEKWLQSLYITQMKFYLSIQNLITVTPYKDGDPTIRYPFELPTIRSFLLGVNLNF
ncbi:MAG: SusC/RagA family TonB-linked outer membrane protein [Pseudobacter sp.]|uniref:SusC/RagA family TonB-linked outer membrane protein n=1 Tax=Pseudobacter sp. TaxID=2045420 RepID=UPI003F81F4D3